MMDMVSLVLTQGYIGFLHVRISNLEDGFTTRT